MKLHYLLFLLALVGCVIEELHARPTGDGEFGSYALALRSKPRPRPKTRPKPKPHISKPPRTIERDAVTPKPNLPQAIDEGLKKAQQGGKRILKKVGDAVIVSTAQEAVDKVFNRDRTSESAESSESAAGKPGRTTAAKSQSGVPVGAIVEGATSLIPVVGPIVTVGWRLISLFTD